MQQGAQRPAGTVTTEHVQIVYVKVCVAVRLADALRVNIVEPIVGDNFTGSIQDQAAQGIALIGVGIYSPIAPLKVLTDRCRDIQQKWFCWLGGYGSDWHDVPPGIASGISLRVHRRPFTGGHSPEIAPC